jgi:NitT/TauT family transport system ATP-binding protein
MSRLPVISVRDLTIRFGDGERAVAALDSVSLDLKQYEFLSVLGPSGCGKSTLLFAVGGLIPSTSGEVNIGGAKLNRPFTDAGVVFQRDGLLEWRTVIDNVMLPVQIKRLPYAPHRDRAQQLLARVGLAGFEDAYPHQLSGGMRQRAALCRALICDLPVLLMDEPFGALDALTREEHQLLLQDVWLADKKTVMFVTHDIHEAVLLSDRVLVMTPRPGSIADIVNIDLPRPRDQEMTTSQEFNDYVRRIRQTLFGKPRPAAGSPIRAVL